MDFESDWHSSKSLERQPRFLVCGCLVPQGSRVVSLVLGVGLQLLLLLINGLLLEVLRVGTHQAIGGDEVVSVGEELAVHIFQCHFGDSGGAGNNSKVPLFILVQGTSKPQTASSKSNGVDTLNEIQSFNVLPDLDGSQLDLLDTVELLSEDHNEFSGSKMLDLACGGQHFLKREYAFVDHFFLGIGDLHDLLEGDGVVDLSASLKQYGGGDGIKGLTLEVSEELGDDKSSEFLEFDSDTLVIIQMKLIGALIEKLQELLVFLFVFLIQGLS